MSIQSPAPNRRAFLATSAAALLAGSAVAGGATPAWSGLADKDFDPTFHRRLSVCGSRRSPPAHRCHALAGA